MGLDRTGESRTRAGSVELVLGSWGDSAENMIRIKKTQPADRRSYPRAVFMSVPFQSNRMDNPAHAGLFQGNR